MTESEIDSPIEQPRARSILRSSDRERDRVTEGEIELPRRSPTAFHMSGPGVGVSGPGVGVSGPGVGARGTYTLCCGVHTVLYVLFVGGWTLTTSICWRGFSLSLQSVQRVDSWPPRGARAAGMSGTVLGVCVCVCMHVCI